MNTLKKVLLRDKFEEISYEEIVEDIKKIEEVKEANLIQLAPN